MYLFSKHGSNCAKNSQKYSEKIHWISTSVMGLIRDFKKCVYFWPNLMVWKHIYDAANIGSTYLDVWTKETLLIKIGKGSGGWTRARTSNY